MKRIIALVMALAVAITMAIGASAQSLTVTSGYANVRSAAGQSNKYLGQVKKNQTYTVLDSGKAANGKVWYKINYNGKNGWVCSSFVKTTSATTTPVSGKMTITGEPTNFRKGAGYKYGVIMKLHKGNVVNSIASANDSSGNTWYRVSYNGTTGWVLGTLVKSGASTLPSVHSAEHKGALIGTFTSTAYCGVEGGGENRYTANGYCLIGKSRTDAMTIAVDKSVIKLGTRVYVEFPAPYQHFSGIYTARDTGGAIKGNKIDLYIGWSNTKDAWNFGVRKGVKIYKVA